MKWKKARGKLLEVAAGRFCSMSFSLTFQDGNPVRTECWLYVDKGMSSGFSIDTWEKAFEVLDQMKMNSKPRELEEEPLGISDQKEGEVE